MNIGLFYKAAIFFTVCIAWQLYGFLGVISSLIAVWICSYASLPGKREISILLVAAVAIKGAQSKMGTAYTMVDSFLYAMLFVALVSILVVCISSQNKNFKSKTGSQDAYSDQSDRNSSIDSNDFYIAQLRNVREIAERAKNKAEKIVASQEETINKLKRELDDYRGNVAASSKANELQASLSREQKLRRAAEQEVFLLKQVSSNKDILENKVYSLNKEKLELENSLRESADTISCLKKEFNTLRRQKHHLKKVDNVDEEKIMKKNQSLEGLNSPITESANIIGELQRQLEEVSSAKSVIEHEVGSLNDENIELKESLKESTDACTSLKKKFDTLKKKNDRLKKENEANEKKIVKKDKSIEGLSSQIAESANTIGVLQRQLKEVSSAKSVIEHEVGSLNDENIELKESLRESTDARTSLKKKFDILKKENDVNKEKILKEDESLKGLNSQIAKSKNTIDTLQRQLEEAAEEKKRLEKEYENVYMNFKQMQQLYDDLVGSA